MDAIGPLPLCAGDEEGADTAFRGDVVLYSADVGLLSGEGNAGTGVDGVLDHQESIIEKELPEACGEFTLFFGQDRQVEENDKPSHFKLLSVHGR